MLILIKEKALKKLLNAIFLLTKMNYYIKIIIAKKVVIGGLMKKIDDIKFNLNRDMLNSLLKFDEIKKELNKLYNLGKSDDVLLKIMEQEHKLNSYRQKFIEDLKE